MKVSLFQGWSVKDYTTVGITAAMCIILGVLVKVVLGLVISSIPALGSLILAMVQVIIITLSIMRLPKVGFLTILGVCMGSIYGFIFPAHSFMFVTFVAAGIVGDSVGWILGGYGKKVGIVGAVLFYRLTVIVFGAVIAWWIGFAKADLAWALILINCAGSVVGVLLGAWIGVKLSAELGRAGLLKV